MDDSARLGGKLRRLGWIVAWTAGGLAGLALAVFLVAWSGVFNVASGNYTLGELADYVHDAVEELLGIDARLNIKHAPDIRTYKVKCEQASRTLGFKPTFEIRDIVGDLVDNLSRFRDFENPAYYNIATFMSLDGAHDSAQVAAARA